MAYGTSVCINASNAVSADLRRVDRRAGVGSGLPRWSPHLLIHKAYNAIVTPSSLPAKTHNARRLKLTELSYARILKAGVTALTRATAGGLAPRYESTASWSCCSHSTSIGGGRGFRSCDEKVQAIPPQHAYDCSQCPQGDCE
jgi:hypothetical protein